MCQRWTGFLWFWTEQGGPDTAAGSSEKCHNPDPGVSFLSGQWYIIQSGLQSA